MLNRFSKQEWIQRTKYALSHGVHDVFHGGVYACVSLYSINNRFILVTGKHAVISILRNKILSGDFAPGERLAEIPTAEALGVSRTPVRIAFRQLAQEGLLTKLPRRGYQVRHLNQEDINGSVEVRGVLEGLAARLAAEKGLSEAHQAQLAECLHEGDEIFADGELTDYDVQRYVEMNNTFHSVILEASCNPAIAAALQPNEFLPMASVSAMVFDPKDSAREYRRLLYAHQQHYAIVDALLNRQGARAEALMKEHAHAALVRFDAVRDSSSVKVYRLAGQK